MAARAATAKILLVLACHCLLHSKLESKLCRDRYCKGPISIGQVIRSSNDAEDQSGMKLSIGDDVVVYSKSDDGTTWEGEVNGKRGLFPEDYIEEFQVYTKELQYVNDDVLTPDYGLDGSGKDHHSDDTSAPPGDDSLNLPSDSYEVPTGDDGLEDAHSGDNDVSKSSVIDGDGSKVLPGDAEQHEVSDTSASAIDSAMKETGANAAEPTVDLAAEKSAVDDVTGVSEAGYDKDLNKDPTAGAEKPHDVRDTQSQVKADVDNSDTNTISRVDLLNKSNPIVDKTEIDTPAPTSTDTVDHNQSGVNENGIRNEAINLDQSIEDGSQMQRDKNGDIPTASLAGNPDAVNENEKASDSSQRDDDASQLHSDRSGDDAVSKVASDETAAETPEQDVVKTDGPDHSNLHKTAEMPSDQHDVLPEVGNVLPDDVSVRHDFKNNLDDSKNQSPDGEASIVTNSEPADQSSVATENPNPGDLANNAEEPVPEASQNYGNQGPLNNDNVMLANETDAASADEDGTENNKRDPMTKLEEVPTPGGASTDSENAIEVDVEFLKKNAVFQNMFQTQKADYIEAHFKNQLMTETLKEMIDNLIFTGLVDLYKQKSDLYRMIHNPTGIDQQAAGQVDVERKTESNRSEEVSETAATAESLVSNEDHDNKDVGHSQAESSQMEAITSTESLSGEASNMNAWHALKVKGEIRPTTSLPIQSVDATDSVPAAKSSVMTPVSSVVVQPSEKLLESTLSSEYQSTTLIDSSTVSVDIASAEPTAATTYQEAASTVPSESYVTDGDGVVPSSTATNSVTEQPEVKTLRPSEVSSSEQLPGSSHVDVRNKETGSSILPQEHASEAHAVNNDNPGASTVLADSSSKNSVPPNGVDEASKPKAAKNPLRNQMKAFMKGLNAHGTEDMSTASAAQQEVVMDQAKKHSGNSAIDQLKRADSSTMATRMTPTPSTDVTPSSTEPQVTDNLDTTISQLQADSLTHLLPTSAVVSSTEIQVTDSLDATANQLSSDSSTQTLSIDPTSSSTEVHMTGAAGMVAGESRGSLENATADLSAAFDKISPEADGSDLIDGIINDVAGKNTPQLDPDALMMAGRQTRQLLEVDDNDIEPAPGGKADDPSSADADVLQPTKTDDDKQAADEHIMTTGENDAATVAPESNGQTDHLTPEKSTVVDNGDVTVIESNVDVDVTSTAATPGMIPEEPTADAEAVVPAETKVEASTVVNDRTPMSASEHDRTNPSMYKIDEDNGHHDAPSGDDDQVMPTEDDMLSVCHTNPSQPMCDHLRGSKIYRPHKKEQDNEVTLAKNSSKMSNESSRMSYYSVYSDLMNVVKLFEQVNVRRLADVLAWLKLTSLAEYAVYCSDNLSRETSFWTFVTLLVTIRIAMIMWKLQGRILGTRIADVTSSYNARLKLLSDERDKYELERTTAIDEQDYYKKQIETKENDIRMMESKIENIDLSSKSLLENIEDLKSQLEKEKDERDKLSKIIESKEKEIRDADEVAKRHQLEIEKQSAVSEELECRFGKVRDELNLKDETIVDLQLKLAALHRDIEALAANRSQVEEAKIELEKRLTDYDDMLSNKDVEITTLKLTINDKLNEIEVLQDCLMKINNGKGVDGDTLDDFDALEHDPDISEQLKSERLKQLLDSTKLCSELKQFTEENENLKEALGEEAERSRDFEASCQQLRSDLDVYVAKYNQAHSERTEMSIKIKTLQEYFQGQEAELQRRLSVEVAAKLASQRQLAETSVTSTAAVESFDSLKQQVEDLKKELKETERANLAKTQAKESENHDLWVKHRQAKRELEEMTRERDIYRKRLLEAETVPRDPKTSKQSTRRTSPSNSSDDGSKRSTPTSATKEQMAAAAANSPRPPFPGPMPPLPPGAMFPRPMGPMGPMGPMPPPFGPPMPMRGPFPPMPHPGMPGFGPPGPYGPPPPAGSGPHSLPGQSHSPNAPSPNRQSTPMSGGQAAGLDASPRSLPPSHFGNNGSHPPQRHPRQSQHGNSPRAKTSPRTGQHHPANPPQSQPQTTSINGATRMMNTSTESPVHQSLV